MFHTSWRLGAIGATVLALLATPAAALTLTLPADTTSYGFWQHDIGGGTGPQRLTVRSSRQMLELEAYTTVFVDYHLHPVSGPAIGDGAKYYEGNQTGLRFGPQAFTIDFTPGNSTESQGCCWYSGGEWVPYEEHWYRTNYLYSYWDFAPGDDPITISFNISPVPEPSAWALLIIGFCSVGAMIRRRRRRELGRDGHAAGVVLKSTLRRSAVMVRAALVVSLTALLAPGAAQAKAIYSEVWKLPGDFEIFGTGLDYRLPSVTGNNRVTLTSSRPFLGPPTPSLYEELHYHDYPVGGGPVFGYVTNIPNMISVDSNLYGFSALYNLSADHSNTGCCVPDDYGQSVPYFAEYHYTQYMFLDADFAPGTDPIFVRLTVTSTAVPEPATWALLILGFGMAGAGLRRHRILTASRAA